MTTAEIVEREKVLTHELGQYAGKWVAVHDQEVVASAESLKELLEQTEGKEIEAVFKAGEDGDTSYFY